MIDVKCKSCDKLLMKASVCVAAIKCPRCKMIFEYKVFSSLHYTNQHDIKTSESSETSPHNGAATTVKV